MRLINNIDRDIKNVKRELLILETKLERLEEEKSEVINKILEEGGISY